MSSESECPVCNFNRCTFTCEFCSEGCERNPCEHISSSLNKSDFAVSGTELTTELSVTSLSVSKESFKKIDFKSSSSSEEDKCPVCGMEDCIPCKRCEYGCQRMTCDCQDSAYDSFEDQYLRKWGNPSEDGERCEVCGMVGCAYRCQHCKEGCAQISCECFSLDLSGSSELLNRLDSSTSNFTYDKDSTADAVEGNSENWISMTPDQNFPFTRGERTNRISMSFRSTNARSNSSSED